MYPSPSPSPSSSSSSIHTPSAAASAIEPPPKLARPKRRPSSSSAPKRSTRFLSTHKSNFRHIVQLLTGFPSTPNSIPFDSDTHQFQRIASSAFPPPSSAAEDPLQFPLSMPTIDTSSAYLRHSSFRHAPHSSTSAISAVTDNTQRRQQLWHTDSSPFPSIAAASSTTALSDHYAAVISDESESREQLLPIMSTFPATIALDGTYNRPNFGSDGAAAADVDVLRHQNYYGRDPDDDELLIYNYNYSIRMGSDWQQGGISSASDIEFAAPSKSPSISLDIIDHHEYDGLPAEPRLQRISRQAAELERLLMAEDVSCSPTATAAGLWSPPPSISYAALLGDLLRPPTPKVITHL